MEQAVDVDNIPQSPGVCDIDRYLFSFIKQRHPGETLSKISEGRFLISRCFLKGMFVYADID